MMINCKEAAYLMDKKGVEKLSFRDNFKLWRHNVACNVCKEYAKFSTKFNTVIKSIKSKPPKLSDDEKNGLKQIMKEMS